MTREEARAKRHEATARFLGIWTVAIIPNALDAFGVDLDGTGWFVVRSALGVLWLAALVIVIAAFVRERRAPPEPETT